MKIFLCNPPTGFFIRDERCQIDVKSRLAENIREPVQILYLAGLLQKQGHDVFFRDYSASHLSIKDALLDVNSFMPDLFYLETTQGTFSNDLSFIKKIDENNKNLEFIVKAPFLDYDYLKKRIEHTNFSSHKKIYFLTRNFENSIISILFGNVQKVNHAYILSDNIISKPNESMSDDDFDMDSYVSPPRYFLNKTDYICPDTCEPIAYIYTSKGCPYDCIFCAAPTYLGKKVLVRSVASIISEIIECVHKYRINNFFFRSDTFTFNKKWVMDFCKCIEKENLKIRWGTNSRADKGDKEMFAAMKSAGCDILGIGIESGSSKILKAIKKGITTDDIIHVNNLIKDSGMRTFFHCIIGFPWDDHDTISETSRFIQKLEPDFVEINVPYPLKGTELYDIASNNSLFVSNDLEAYSHVKPILRTFHLNEKEVGSLRKKLIASFYLRPKYIIKSLKRAKNPKVFLNYVKWGCMLIRKVVF